MLDSLKTLRDLGFTAGIVLTAFGSPVGVAALRDAPMIQSVLEEPAANSRVVVLPAPPPIAEAAKLAEAPAEAAPSETASEGDSRIAAEPVGTRGIRATRRSGTVSGATRGGSARRPSTKKPAARNACTPDNPQIVLQSTWDRVVDRSLVDHYAGNIPELNRLGHVKKHVDEGGGKSDGLLVRGIRCGNDLHELGIRNNDVVHTVNGKKVKNLVQAIAVYFQLRSEEDFRVELTRGGKRMTLTYRLV